MKEMTREWYEAFVAEVERWRAFRLARPEDARRIEDAMFRAPPMAVDTPDDLLMLARAKEYARRKLEDAHDT
jgi:hypothetical protein